jgi:hypothetical protein
MSRNIILKIIRHFPPASNDIGQWWKHTILCVLCTRCITWMCNIEYCHTTCFTSQITSRISVTFCLFNNTVELSPSGEPANYVATEELSSSYGTRRFITVFTRPLHWSLSRVRWSQSVQSHPISLRSVLMLLPHVRLDLPRGLFRSDFTTEPLYNSLRAHSCYMPCPCNAPWLDHSNFI